MANNLKVLCLMATMIAVTFGLKKNSIKVGAFNCQTFGVAKMSDATRADHIADIIRRYDVMLLQEIRDSKGSSISALLDLLNKYYPFNIVLSDRLGRSSNYKEQYGFIYRSDKLKVIDTYQYDDSAGDVFEREPFSVKMRLTEPGSTFEFALVGLHSKPDDAVPEILKLSDVTSSVQTNFGTMNVMLMGDLNADCSYCKVSDLQNKDITSAAFKWLVDWDADTTVSDTDCAYDRIIATGNELLDAYDTYSVSIYRYDIVFGMSQEQAKTISDHYPVEVDLIIP